MYSLKNHNTMNSHIPRLGRRTFPALQESFREPLLHYYLLFPFQRFSLSSLLNIPLCLSFGTHVCFLKHISFNFEQINHKNQTSFVGKVNIAIVRVRFPGEDKLNRVSGAQSEINFSKSVQGPLGKLVDKTIDECEKYSSSQLDIWKI